jgi:GxxExxY protein
MKHKDVTDKIIGCFFTVYNELGYGFLESVYERAMMIELEKQGLRVACQYPIRVYYDGQVVGDFRADLLVEDRVVVELKAAPQLAIQHEAQLLNYLNATGYEVGLLLNFGPQARFKRKIFDNERKCYRVPQAAATRLNQ